MKCLAIYLTCSVCIFAGICLAQHQNSPLTAFEEGVRHYKLSEFEQASESFERSLESDGLSAATHFNLAKTYEKLGQLSKSIIHLRTARSIAPRDDAIALALDRVRETVGTRSAPTVTTFSPLHPFSILSLSGVRLFFLFSLSFLVSSVTLIHLKGIQIAKIRFAAYASFICSLYFAYYSFAWDYNWLGELTISSENSSAVVVLKPDTNIYAGISADSQVVDVASEGEELIARKMDNNWVLVTLGDRRTGWIEKENVIYIAN